MSKVIGEIVERAVMGGAREVAEGAIKSSPALENLLARKAVAGVSQPADAWFSGLHTKVNELLGGEAKTSFGRRAQTLGEAPKLDIFGAYRGVTEAQRGMNTVQERLLDNLRPIVKGLDDSKLADFGELLKAPEEHWARTAQRFRLSDADLAKARAWKEWDAELQRESGLSFIEGLKKLELSRTQALTGDTAWDRLITQGHLNPNSSNVARVIDTAINTGLQEKFLKEPFKAFEAMANTRNADGRFLLDKVRPILRNYQQFVEGTPDVTRRVIEGYASALGDGMQRIFGKNAAHWFGMDKGGRQVLQNAMTFSAAANLALKPSLLVRDAFDLHRPMAVMGTDFIRGLAKAMTPEGWEAAEGVAMQGKNITQMMGNLDQTIFRGRPTQVAEALLAPTRWINTLGRKATYLGEFDRAAKSLSAFRAGTLSEQGLIDSTSLAFHDPAPRSQLLTMAMNREIPVPIVADAFGRQAVDSILFSFQYGNQPAALRTGLGRVLGQFGQWPMHYIEFLKRLARMTRDNPGRGVPTLAAWIGMNAAAKAAAQSVDVDVDGWTYFAPAGYRGGPYLELVQNIAAAAGEDATAIQARKNILTFPLDNFIPGAGAFRQIYRASQEPGGIGSPAGTARILGFHPEDKNAQDLEMDEWLRNELGFGTGRAR